MTTVEAYRSNSLDFHTDATSNLTRIHPPSTAIKKRIPPAVPSPPRRSSDSPPRKSRPNIEYHIVEMAEEANQWLFTEAELASSPSIVDGISPTEERMRRAKGVNFIIQAGILLKLPQLTLATASVFFHRFYMRSSMVEEKHGIHHYNIAATALFLATKTEENCRKTKEIVIAVAKVAQKNSSLIIDEQSKEYWRWRDSMLLYEELMLEYLTFDVVLVPPYKYLYKYINDLHIEDNKQVRNVAWSFINDSCLTPLCLVMPPKHIAIAAIYFALKFAGDSIDDDKDGNGWWVQLGGEPEKIIQAVGVMNIFFKENPLGRRDASPTSGDEDPDSTRKPRDESMDPRTPSPDGRRTSPESNMEPSQQEESHTNGAKTPAGAVEKPDIKMESPPDIKISTEDANDQTQKLEELENEASGSSDKVLKEAANDPTTHQLSSDANGIANTPSQASQPTPKRKTIDEIDTEPSAKRTKSEAAVPEESEEGELPDA